MILLTHTRHIHCISFGELIACSIYVNLIGILVPYLHMGLFLMLIFDSLYRMGGLSCV